MSKKCLVFGFLEADSITWSLCYVWQATPAGALEPHRYLAWRQGMGHIPSELSAIGYCLVDVL